MKNDLCVMCGINNATLTIANPNGEEGLWNVCGDCADFVVGAKKMAIEVMVAETLGEDTERIMQKYGWAKKESNES